MRPHGTYSLLSCMRVGCIVSAVVTVLWHWPLWKLWMALLEYGDALWIRSLPLSDEVRAWESAAFLSDVEVPVVLTSERNLHTLEREGAMLEISGSDRSHLALSKSLERCVSTGRVCSFAIMNPCADNEACEPSHVKIQVVERTFALIVDVEGVEWSTHGRRSMAKIRGRFVQRGKLRSVHEAFGSEHLRYFGASVERRRGDVIVRKADTTRRGAVLLVDWVERSTSTKLPDLAAINVAARIFGAVFEIQVAKRSRHEAVYTVLTEDGSIERWFDAGVLGHSRPPLVLHGSCELWHNPTKATKPNVDRNHYELGARWATELLRFVCRRDSCVFVRAKHKGFGDVCDVALYQSVTLWIGASRAAPKPPNSTLVKRNFAKHGCCPPAIVDLYATAFSPGIVRLPSHSNRGEGPEAHTYLMLFQLHDGDLHFEATNPRARNLVDAAFDTGVDFVHPPPFVSNSLAPQLCATSPRLVFRPRPTPHFPSHPMSRFNLRRNVSQPPSPLPPSPSTERGTQQNRFGPSKNIPKSAIPAVSRLTDMSPPVERFVLDAARDQMRL